MNRLILLFFYSLASFSAAAEHPPVLAHYMPWYASKEHSGSWGWHWTMDHFDPDRIKWTGDREAASHDYPLLGLYDSSDPYLLETHALLMKFAGIDGVIVDWYGAHDFYDYEQLHQNTKALIPYIKKAGLKFAICYEDQTVKHQKKQKKITDDQALQLGMMDLGWLDDNWLQDEAYFQVNDRPALLVFGPQYYEKDNWNSLRDSLSTKPLLYALPHGVERANADGGFAWPPVEQPDWRTQLKEMKASIPAVFPGFHDIYKQAGVQEGYRKIDDENGATFSETLNLAIESNAPFVQLITWNDFGEGTQIEPTRKLGYRYLDALQSKLKPDYKPSDLRLPIRLYQLRQRLDDERLDRAAALLYESKCDEAAVLLYEIAEQPQTIDSNYELVTGIGYAEGDEYREMRCKLDVYYPTHAKEYSTVIWFHGGGISKGGRTVPTPLRNKGVAVVTADYRLSPKVEAPEYIKDAATAVAWTINNIANYGGDPSRVFVSGHSAGGYLASMVGLDPQYLAELDLETEDIAG
ncbi:MAG: alpha/beta hydrolase fold domain-containing protein, partial [Verrucomicrobiota bacterium]